MIRCYCPDEKAASSDEGPIKIINREEVPTEPSSLIEGFHWVTMDLTDEKEACVQFADLYGLA